VSFARCQASVALGTYVLGAIDRRDRAEFESHLVHCVVCRDELITLAPLPGLLSRLTLDELEAASVIARSPHQGHGRGTR